MLPKGIDVMNRMIAAMIFVLLGLGSAGPMRAGEAADALAARNPALAALRSSDPRGFESAAAIIAERQAAEGLKPGIDPLPDSRPTGRDMGGAPGREFTTDNPDILWLYNTSPEGMRDLISILKTAGQKPKT